MSRYGEDFDFFQFLDKQLQEQNEKLPVPKGLVQKEGKEAIDGRKENYWFSGRFQKQPQSKEQLCSSGETSPQNPKVPDQQLSVMKYNVSSQICEHIQGKAIEIKQRRRMKGVPFKVQTEAERNLDPSNFKEHCTDL